MRKNVVSGRLVMSIAVAALGAMLANSAVAHTRNIMLTGYWPPTNEMLRQFSQNSWQNPQGWQGENWEGRGYDVYSFFPEFENFPSDPVGTGDFRVDYQFTSEDWWRITREIRPVAIITFSRGASGMWWEIEMNQRNLVNWNLDYIFPFRPTPNPPDPTVPMGHVRRSTLPVEEIRDAVAEADLGLNAFIDWNGFGGAFLSEFIAYHGVWYQDMHSAVDDPYRSVAAGHIHVGVNVPVATAKIAAEISLREVIAHVDRILIPEPSFGGWLLLMGWMFLRRGVSAN